MQSPDLQNCSDSSAGTHGGCLQRNNMASFTKLTSLDLSPPAHAGQSKLENFPSIPMEPDLLLWNSNSLDELPVVFEKDHSPTSSSPSEVRHVQRKKRDSLVALNRGRPCCG